MMAGNGQKTQLERYNALKNQVQLPVKVKLYFLIFDNAMETNKAPRSIESKKGFSKALLNAFTNLSIQQKGLYLLDGLNYVLEQLDKQQKDKTKSDSKSQCITDEIKHIETTCQMAFTTMKISHWNTVSFKLDKIKKQINITNKKKSNVIDIRNYYIRKSKKYKATLVLEAIVDDINNEAKKYLFSFSQQVVQKVYEQILKCVFISQHQKLLSMLVDDEDQDKMSTSKVSHNSNPQKTLVFLSSKNINSYISFKQKILTQILKNKFDFKPIYKRDTGLTIQQSFKVHNVFKLESTFQIQAKILKQKFVYAFNHKNKFILHSQILQDFSKKYKALYEKYLVGGKVHEFIAIREQTITNQQQILFIKGIENVMSKVYLEFLQVKVRVLNPFKSRLTIHCGLNVMSGINKDMAKGLLLEMNDMILRKEDIELRVMATEMNEDDEVIGKETGEDNDEDQFRTVRGSQEFVDFMEDDGESEMNTSRMKVAQEYLMNQNVSCHNFEEGKKYLNKKHSLVPVEDQQLRKYMKNHYLFKEWVRIKSGGVVCTNQHIINVQKNLFKSTLAKMGRGILKGQIFKLSIPVIIFKKQSHLESIGKDFCFAPTFFDKVSQGADCLERVKYASLLAISVGTLGISMDKPFNPILGQTFQGWIDGCPIYLEQISHHPPIGAYFMQGRGYRIHGQIEPKISFGLNNVKGYSDLPNYLQFDDGTQIQMTYGKMVIKGMLFGDREFNFADRIYAYDKKNHLFSQICYGPKKKSSKKKADPNDYYHGSIYKLKPDFLEKFNQSRPRIYPTRNDILNELSTFEGVWNDSCTFDGKQYINFRTDLPHDLIHEEQPLLSNSSFRGDLIKVIEGDLVEAQKQKDRLQDIQRRDRKLRQKYGKVQNK